MKSTRHMLAVVAVMASCFCANAEAMTQEKSVPHSEISEFGYGRLRFGDQFPAGEIPYMTNDVYVSTRYEPMYDARDIKDDNGFAIAMKWYYRDGRGLCEIALSPGADFGPLDGYDEAFRKFEDFKAKVERELSISLPDTQIVVSKDEYDNIIEEHKIKEQEEAAKGHDASFEWTVFSIPSFVHKGVRISIWSSAWTKCPTTIQMSLRKIEKDQQNQSTATRPESWRLRREAERRARKQNDTERDERREQLKAIQEELVKQRLQRSTRVIGRRNKSEIELTDAEKELDIDSFAGFKFGAVIDDCDVLQGSNLVAPFRGFSRIQLFRTAFGHRIYSVVLTANISDWTMQSVTNEVVCLRDMLAAEYGITHWNPQLDSGASFSFENDNVRVSIHATTVRQSHGPRLWLRVTNHRIGSDDARACDAAKKSIVFESSQDFTELARIAETVELGNHNDIPIAKLLSGFGIMKSDGIDFDNTKVIFDGQGKNVTVKVCTRVTSDGMDFEYKFRIFEISPDGRILSISEEFGW